jgi:hypothetical protein
VTWNNLLLATSLLSRRLCCADLPVVTAVHVYASGHPILKPWGSYHVVSHTRFSQVALFKVVVHGTGFRIPSLDGVGEVAGFYRVQKVRAATESLAEDRALCDVRDDWNAGRCSSYGANPALTVERVTQVSLLQYLAHRNGAHLYYPAES